jgi:hemerythrin-like domain-containing protein
MVQRDVAKRCRAEFERLQTVKGALRITLNWRTPAIGLPRKLESLLFIIRALQRHLEMQLDLEEQGGYLDIVEEFKPNLAEAKDRLRDEHDHFRASLEQILPTVEELSPQDEQRVEDICQELFNLLARIDQHELQEAELLQEAIASDEGGEG